MSRDHHLTRREAIKFGAGAFLSVARGRLPDAAMRKRIEQYFDQLA
jgi:hypothetical protein